MGDRELREIIIKNFIYYYLNDLININDLDFEKNIFREKIAENDFIILDKKFQMVLYIVL